MTQLGGILLAAALFAIGYVPMQRLRSRRAAVIAGIAGIALIPVALALLRLYSMLPDTTLLVVVFLYWLIPVGFAMLCGAIVRFFIVGRRALTRRDIWSIAAICAIGLFILMTMLARALVNGLD